MNDADDFSDGDKVLEVVLGEGMLRNSSCMLEFSRELGCHGNLPSIEEALLRKLAPALVL